MKTENICCFFGHRQIKITEELKNKLQTIIENLIISENVTAFLFGSRSQFDDLCHSVVTELRNKYSDIRRICYLTKSESAVLETDREALEKSYSKLLKKNIRLKGFEELILPEKVYSSGKASYVERNQLMIDKSDFCVIYYEENYLPPRRKSSKHDVLTYQPKSGTKLGYDYAVRKKKTIINVYE